MIMLDQFLPDEGVQYCPEVTEVRVPTGVSDKEELRLLKIEHGAFKLAPMLVTPSSMWQKNLISAVVEPIWKHHGTRNK